jgi:hypothetical protein
MNMKNNFVRLFLLALLSVFVAACDKKNDLQEKVNPTENEGGGGLSTAPERCLEIVRFVNDEYRNCIIAETFDYKTARMRGSGNRPPLVEEFIIGSNPFSVQLPNGYWVIDWRWDTFFIYPPTNVLIKSPWEDLHGWYDTFDLASYPHLFTFSDYIEDFGFIRRRDLDSINNRIVKDKQEAQILYDSEFAWSFGSRNCKYLTDLPMEDRESYLDFVKQQDSIHAYYVESLKEIVLNERLEDIIIRWTENDSSAE